MGFAVAVRVGWDSQHGADGGDGGEEVDIVELWHMHVGETGGYMIKAAFSLTPCARAFPIEWLTSA